MGGGEEERGGVWEPQTPPPAPSRRDGFVPKGAPPPSASPCFCSLSRRPRRVGFHLGGEAPDAPASLRGGSSGLDLGPQVGGPGRVLG